MINRPITLAVVLFFPLTACSDREPLWTGTMYDSAGVTIVTNTDVGIWSPGEEWTLEEELRIEAVEGNPDHGFGQVGGIAVDSNDRLFVLDRQDQHVQVYSPEGVYEQTIGVQRDGPGQWGGALFLLMGRGDTLLVGDGQAQLIYRHAPDGLRVGSFRFVLETGFPMHLVVTPSGVFAEQVRRTPVPGQTTVEQPMDAIVLLGSNGMLTDTLITIPSGEELPLDGGMVLYAPEAVWDLTDTLQLILGINDDYRIGLYSEGKLRRIFTKPFDRRPVSESDKEAELSVLERRWAELGLTAVGMERMRNNTQFSDLLPAFQSVEFGPVGTIWVQHLLPPSELSLEKMAFLGGVRGTQGWDVFDSDGRFLGVVNAGRRFFPLLFRGDRIYGVWDDLDELHVVRLRVVGDLGAGAV
jgi:hypothetical protein